MAGVQGNVSTSEDKRSGITSDPNRADDPQHIVRLVGQVVTVSVETVRLVRALLAGVALPASDSRGGELKRAVLVSSYDNEHGGVEEEEPGDDEPGSRKPGDRERTVA